MNTTSRKPLVVISPGAGLLALEQRVRRDRRAVDEAADRTMSRPRLREHCLYAVGRVCGARGFGDDELAGLGVEEREVGERPADVDADPEAQRATPAPDGERQPPRSDRP